MIRDKWSDTVFSFMTVKENDKHDKANGQFAPKSGKSSGKSAPKSGKSSESEPEGDRWYLHGGAKTDAEKYARYKKGGNPPAHFKDDEKKKWKRRVENSDKYFSHDATDQVANNAAREAKEDSDFQYGSPEGHDKILRKHLAKGIGEGKGKHFETMLAGSKHHLKRIIKNSPSDSDSDSDDAPPDDD